MFVADEGQPAVWRLSAAGETITETILTSAAAGSGQLAKVTVSSLCHYCLFCHVMSINVCVTVSELIRVIV